MKETKHLTKNQSRRPLDPPLMIPLALLLLPLYHQIMLISSFNNKEVKPQMEEEEEEENEPSSSISLRMALNWFLNSRNSSSALWIRWMSWFSGRGAASAAITTGRRGDTDGGASLYSGGSTTTGFWTASFSSICLLQRDKIKTKMCKLSKRQPKTKSKLNWPNFNQQRSITQASNAYTIWKHSISFRAHKGTV